jgi:(1->4)-alpha-D-glucan 1-alpha-D-glucosylmutase
VFVRGWLAERADVIGTEPGHPLDPAIALLALQTAATATPIDQERLTHYLVKAAREAHTRTWWVEPDAAYEQRVGELAGALGRELDDDGEPPTGARSLAWFAERTRRAGWSNSLAIVTLRTTCPGVPDLYQGSSAFLYSLVDPDNRTPPPWADRRALVERAHTTDGPSAWAARDQPTEPHAPIEVAKAVVMCRTLALRRRRPTSFGPGAGYVPLWATGDRRDHIVAYGRGPGAATAPDVVVAVLRLPIGLGDQPDRWGDTALDLPAGDWRNILDDDAPQLRGGVRSATELLERFPVAVAGPARARFPGRRPAGPRSGTPRRRPSRDPRCRRRRWPRRCRPSSRSCAAGP